MSVEKENPTGESGGILRWCQLAIICGAFFIDIANLGMCTIALPSIRDELDFDEGSLQWVMTAYALTVGGFLLVGGRLGDIFGHQIVMKGGVFFFTAFSLQCALVPNKVGLIIGRALQGWAAAFTIPCAQAHVPYLFPDPSKRAVAFGWWGAAGSTGFVIGPILGGLFTSFLGWRWVFWFTLIFSGTILVLSLLLLRGMPHAHDGTKQRDVLKSIDPLGVLLSIPGLILLIFGLTSGNEYGWGSGEVIGTLVGAVVLLVAFAFVEIKIAAEPLLPRHLFRNRTVAVGIGLAACTYAVWQGVNYFLTLELQDFGFTPLQTALRFIPLGVTAFAVNMVIPQLLNRPHIFSPRLLFCLAWVITIPGVVLIALLRDKNDYWRYAFPGMILYICGVGTVYLVANVTVVGSARLEDQGSVAGVFNMSLQVGGAVLGIAVLTVIDNAITDKGTGGRNNAHSRLQGYRAAYYGAIGFAVLGALLSVFVVAPKPPQETTPADEEGKAGSESIEADDTARSSRDKNAPVEEA